MQSTVRSLVVITALLSATSIVTTAQASTNSWTGGTSKWENYADWSVGHPPSLNDLADVITNAGNNSITIDETTVDPDGFSGTGGTCPCQPNTVQLTINGLFSPGDVWSALLYRNGYGSWATNIGEVAYSAAWQQYSSGTGYWAGKLVFGGYYTVSSISPYLTQPCDYSAYWTSGSTTYTVSSPYNGCQDWVPPGWMTVSNLTISAPIGSTNTLYVVETDPVPLVVNGNLTIEGNGVLGISQASVFVTNSATGLGNASVGVDGTNATLTIPYGGVLIDQNGCVGCSNAVSGAVGKGASNLVEVGFNSLWSNAVLQVGQYGASNKVIIEAGGEIDVSDTYANNFVMGDTDVYSPSSGGYNSVLVSDPGSLLNIPVGGTVGQFSPGNQLVVTNHGSVFGGSYEVGGINYSQSLGIGVLAGGNLVLVTGSGSIISNLAVVVDGAANQLIIRDGGRIYGTSGTLGPEGEIFSDYTPLLSGNNSALVTGSGSIWGMSLSLDVGEQSTNNELIIADGGLVYDGIAVIGDVAFGAESDGNTVLVTDSGSVWSNTAELMIGYESGMNQLIVTNGGHVYCQTAILGGGASEEGTIFCNNNRVLVTGSGSLWGNQSNLTVGNYGSGNQVVITNGGLAYNRDVYLGVFTYTNSIIYRAYSNSVLVTGSGSVWSNTGNVFVGYGGPTNRIVVADSGLMIASNICIGYTTEAVGNQVIVTNGSLALANTLEIRNGALTFSGGSVTANQLLMTNLVGSRMTFNSGTLTSAGTTVSNGLQFVVGDGVQPATFYMNGSVNYFHDGLRIKNNAVLHTCGTITGGSIVIDPGGSQVCP